MRRPLETRNWNGCDEKERRCYAKCAKLKSAEYARNTKLRGRPTMRAPAQDPA
ncbi:hypothetical protein AAVH_34572, partial [Aphelenchoides avenae]